MRCRVVSKFFTNDAPIVFLILSNIHITVKKMMSLKKMKYIAALGVLSALTGCASMGESNFKCKGYPDGLACHSPQEVLKLTDGDDYKAQINKAAREARSEEGEEVEDSSLLKEDSSQLRKEKVNTENVLNVIPEHSKGVIPLRTPAQVMRIQVRPWESETNDLFVPGYIYTEIEPRRWMIGNKSVNVNDNLIPVIQQKNPVQNKEKGSSQNAALNASMNF